LIAPLPANAGKGHRYQSPHRLRNRDLLAGEFGKALHGLRGRIERSFGNPRCSLDRPFRHSLAAYTRRKVTTVKLNRTACGLALAKELP
jgi:hypothetical protein